MRLILQSLPCIFLAIVCSLSAQTSDVGVTNDVGAESVGELKVSVFYGTNGDVAQAGEGLTALSAKQVEHLKKLKKIKFSHYKVVGEDSQQLLRSYENWAKPLKQSKQILISFQPSGEVVDRSVKLDLEFWQKDKKIMKNAPVLSIGKPLFILGPEWRGGRLIIAVELMSLVGEASAE